MTTPSFRYEPLSTRNREIRLLSLRPGSPDDPIHCLLTTQKLSDNPTYTALSYVWGDPATAQDPHNAVTLNNHPFRVTANLFSALRHIRRASTTNESMVLWVDALCINQDDLDERGQQVGIMRDIYASAERVVIWLGVDDESASDGVFERIREYDALDKKCREGEENEPLGRSGDKLDPRRLGLLRGCTDFLFNIAVAHPWFSRVWILQELAMARNDPLVVCGWQSVSWSALVGAWKAIAREVFTEIGGRFVREHNSRHGAKLESPEALGDGAKKREQHTEVLAHVKLDVLDELLNARRANGGESLRRLLILSRTSKSTDPKDKIYGLLGLLAPGETAPPSIPIPIDYRKPIWEVYSDAVSHIFSRGEGPYFLSGVYLPGVSNPYQLPSWVPDISRQSAEMVTQPSGMQFHPPAGMTASGAGAVCMNGRRLPDKRTLRVEGLLIDEIDEVVPLGSSFAELVRQLPHIASVAAAASQRSCQNVNPQVALLTDGFKRKEPLWRALVYNKKWMSGYDAAPEAYREMHLELLHRKIHPGENYKPSNEYEHCLEQGVGSRVFFTTRNGFIGTCVADGLAGDVLAIWFGSPVPFVLRPGAGLVEVSGVGKQTYVLVGASYVGGIMNGEMVDELFCEDLVDAMTFYVR